MKACMKFLTKEGSEVCLVSDGTDRLFTILKVACCALNLLLDIFTLLYRMTVK